MRSSAASDVYKRQKTRSSYDDGKLAVNLTYAVYDEEGNNIATLNGTETFDENLKTTVKLNLITGKTYTVVLIKLSS